MVGLVLLRLYPPYVLLWGSVWLQAFRVSSDSALFIATLSVCHSSSVDIVFIKSTITIPSVISSYRVRRTGTIYYIFHSVSGRTK